MFERYVNFEFYKPLGLISNYDKLFERYVNFEFYKPADFIGCVAFGLRDM